MKFATLSNPQTHAPVVLLETEAGWISIRDLLRDSTDGTTCPPSFLDSLPDITEITTWGTPNLTPQHLPTDRLLPPIPRPPSFRDFYAFEQHVARCRKRRGLAMDPVWYEQPVFYFSSPASLVGHGHPVFAPAGSAQLDFELELGLVIGKPGRDISRDNAWDHVAGFTIVNDFSARDLQRKEMSVGLGPAKGKDFATAVGPFLVTLDEFHDRIDSEGRLRLEMLARVNGRELSRANAIDMYFTWPQIIQYASRDTDLLTGDLLASGTAGTGCILELGPENTRGWLKPGDVVELEIERLGILRTPIIARPDPSKPAQLSEVMSCQYT